MFNKNDTIKVGDKVLVVIDGSVQELEIVDLPQGDPKKGKISFLSPLARAILGHKYPELVRVKLPNGNTLDCQLVRPVVS
ncbi:GreA/GreB family elongation factor [Candidatus Falkowbacteria bacterium]|nr:GreA/GreB family elongation factor [Candidatus Falkowbacteria bacterium]